MTQNPETARTFTDPADLTANADTDREERRFATLELELEHMAQMFPLLAEALGKILSKFNF